MNKKFKMSGEKAMFGTKMKKFSIKSQKSKGIDMPKPKLSKNY